MTESEIYQQTLQDGLALLCEGMGVNQEKYDTDQADIECYLDCFREASKLLKQAGCKFNDDTGEFIINNHQQK